LITKNAERQMPPSGISRVCRDRSLVAKRENFRSVAMAMAVPRSAFNLRSTSVEEGGRRGSMVAPATRRAAKIHLVPSPTRDGHGSEPVLPRDRGGREGPGWLRVPAVDELPRPRLHH